MDLLEIGKVKTGGLLDIGKGGLWKLENKKLRYWRSLVHPKLDTEGYWKWTYWDTGKVKTGGLLDTGKVDFGNWKTQN